MSTTTYRLTRADTDRWPVRSHDAAAEQTQDSIPAYRPPQDRPPRRGAVSRAAGPLVGVVLVAGAVFAAVTVYNYGHAGPGPVAAAPFGTGPVINQFGAASAAPAPAHLTPLVRRPPSSRAQVPVIVSPLMPSPASATPSSRHSAKPSPKPSASTSTPAPSATPSITPSGTPTGTPSPSPSGTPGPTPSGTPSPTPSPSGTPSPTPSGT